MNSQTLKQYAQGQHGFAPGLLQMYNSFQFSTFMELLNVSTSCFHILVYENSMVLVTCLEAHLFFC